MFTGLWYNLNTIIVCNKSGFVRVIVIKFLNDIRNAENQYLIIEKL